MIGWLSQLVRLNICETVVSRTPEHYQATAGHLGKGRIVVIGQSSPLTSPFYFRVIELPHLPNSVEWKFTSLTLGCAQQIGVGHKYVEVLTHELLRFYHI